MNEKKLDMWPPADFVYKNLSPSRPLNGSSNGCSRGTWDLAESMRPQVDHGEGKIPVIDWETARVAGYLMNSISW